MKQYSYDVVIIGGGPAGLAAADSACKSGAERVAIIERDFRLGGILEQCIHTGFGLKRFNEELSGPEYAHRFIAKVESDRIDVFLNTMVLRIEGEKRIVHAANKEGLLQIQAGAIVLAMGCRERTRTQLAIPGTRPAGIFTAGTAQRLINIQNYKVGKEIVILGSGDIGMIMARRMSLGGAHVKAVVEIMPYLAGLKRNRVQCLDDFGIPLYLKHTITNIIGKNRVEAVTVSKVDERNVPIAGTSFDIACDTLLCSVGLIPENELSKSAGVRLDPLTNGPVVDSTMETSVPGIFACGNVLHVNDLVDNVSSESELCGKSAALYVKKPRVSDKKIPIRVGGNIRYTMPQFASIDGSEQQEIRVFFRVGKPMRDVTFRAMCGDTVLYNHKKKFANPGEMESIVLQPGAVNSTLAEPIVISAVEG